MQIFDIIIIGAGPSGMFAAFYAGLRNMRIKIIDSLPYLGGQLTTLYPEKYIYDIPGYSKIKAIDLIKNLKKQLDLFNHSYSLEEKLLNIHIKNRYIQISTSKNVYYSKTIILALGNGAFQPKKLSISDAEIFHGKGIDYYISNKKKYAHKKILIAGGGNSAVDSALMLSSIGSEVSIVHYRSQFRAHEYSLTCLKKSSVNILTPYHINKVSGKKYLEKVFLKEDITGKIISLSIDYLIVNYGLISEIDLTEWGISQNKRRIYVNSEMQASLKGIYACGDVTDYKGKIRLIATGFGEAPTAVNNALHYIDSENRMQPAHSTMLFQF